MRRFWCCLLSLFVAGPAYAAPLKPVESAIDGFIRPAFRAFDAETANLAGAIDALCAAPTSQALDKARQGFAGTVRAWSRVEFIRIGPLGEQNRLERILFWPDRKSTGLKQVQGALADEDPTATDATALAGKSVAMQGLGALEFILFGAGSDALSADGASYRCAYGRAIGHNVESMAAAVASEWNDANGFASTWSNPAGDNASYRDEPEALGALVSLLVNGTEFVRDARLNAFLGAAAAEDKPKQAVFWRSQLTLASLAANLDGIGELTKAAGFEEFLDADQNWIPGSVAFEISHARQALASTDGALADLLGDPAARGKLDYVRLTTSNLSELFGKRLADALGVSAGFSSLDGD